MWNEAVVVVYHAKEVHETVLIGRLRELLDGLTLAVEWSDTCWSNSVAKEGERGHTELGLFSFDMDTIVL